MLHPKTNQCNNMYCTFIKFRKILTMQSVDIATCNIELPNSVNSNKNYDVDTEDSIIDSPLPLTSLGDKDHRKHICWP